MMKSLKKVFVQQIVPTLATAGVAALLAFVQSLAAQNGASCSVGADPVAAGSVGAAIRLGLETLRMRSVA